MSIRQIPRYLPEPLPTPLPEAFLREVRLYLLLALKARSEVSEALFQQLLHDNAHHDGA